MLSRNLGSNWRPPPELPEKYNQILTETVTWNELISNQFQFGNPIYKLYEDFSCIHKFTIKEIQMLGDLFQDKNIEYLKILYKMELISRFRIQRLLEVFLKYGHHIYLNNLKDRYLECIGVFFGSTGRFEASKTSDYEFVFIRKDIDFTTNKLKREFTDELRKIKFEVLSELEKCPIYKGSHPCGIINKYGITRTWKRMYNERRLWLIAYLFGYCFFSNPDYLHTEMKKAVIQNLGIDTIVKERINRKGVKRFEKYFRHAPDENIQVSIKDMKNFGMDSIQSLSLLHLKEKAGHSLIDDVLIMHKNNILNINQTRAMILAILEIYRARDVRDRDDQKITTTPKKLSGFKIAFDLLHEEGFLSIY